MIQNLLETPETLSPGVETVLRWEQHIRQSPPKAAREFLLQSPPSNSSDFVYYFQIRLLISMGFPIDAVDIINGGKNPLSDRDRITLELPALAEANFQRSYHKLFDNILRIPPQFGSDRYSRLSSDHSPQSGILSTDQNTAHPRPPFLA